MENEWIFSSPKLERERLEQEQRQADKRQEDERKLQEDKKADRKAEVVKPKEHIKLSAKKQEDYSKVVEKMVERAKSHDADLSKIEVKGEQKFVDASKQALQREMQKDRARYEEMKVEAHTKQDLQKEQERRAQERGR